MFADLATVPVHLRLSSVWRHIWGFPLSVFLLPNVPKTFHYTQSFSFWTVHCSDVLVLLREQLIANWTGGPTGWVVVTGYLWNVFRRRAGLPVTHLANCSCMLLLKLGNLNRARTQNAAKYETRGHRCPESHNVSNKSAHFVLHSDPFICTGK